MTSRSALANYIVNNLEQDRENVVRQVAAWLSTHGRKRDVSYVTQDVANILQQRGEVWARVTVARPITDDVRQQIENYIKFATHAKEVGLDVVVDPGHIGGVRIDTPQGSLDASVRTQLTDFVQGVK